MAGLQPGIYQPGSSLPGQGSPNRMPGAPLGFIMNPYLPAAPPTIQPNLNPTPVPPGVGRGRDDADDGNPKEKIDESSDESNRRTPQYDGGVREGYGTLGRDLADPGALRELLTAIPQVLSKGTPFGMANTASQILTDRTIPENIKGLLSVFTGGVPSVPTTMSDSYSTGYTTYPIPPVTVEQLPEPGRNFGYPVPPVTVEQLRPDFNMSLDALLATIAGLTTDTDQANNARIKALQDAKYLSDDDIQLLSSGTEYYNYDPVYQDWLMDEQQRVNDEARDLE